MGKSKAITTWMVTAFAFANISFGRAINSSPEMERVRLNNAWCQKIEAAEKENIVSKFICGIIRDYRHQFQCPVLWRLDPRSLWDEKARLTVWQLTDLYWLHLFHVPTQYEYISIEQCYLVSNRVVWEVLGPDHEKGIHFCIPWTIWGWKYRTLNEVQRKQLETFFGVYQGP